MAPRDRQHIVVARAASREPYTSHGSGRESPRPAAPIDRFAHGNALARAMEAVASQSASRRNTAEASAGVAATGDGIYVAFEGFPGFQLKPETFDPQRSGDQPELIAVQQIVRNDEVVERATVFVPDGKLSYFISRFEQYASEDTPAGKRKNAGFVERIASIQLAAIEALWTDDPDHFPEPEDVVWWEVWLRHTDGDEVARLQFAAESLGFEVGPRHLIFDRRTIVLARSSAEQLASAVDLLDDFAELRRPRISAEFFAGLSQLDQREWIDGLLGRLAPALPDAPSICVLDTGVNRTHPLLSASIAAADTHAVDPRWGTGDHDGHGTAMAGLALLGDLEALLTSGQRVALRHRLESVKVLPPPPGENAPELYGAITADAVNRVEIEAPGQRRSFVMAITADSDGPAGAPTSWSASMDALAAGRSFDSSSGELKYLDEHSVRHHRLFVVSAGNVWNPDGAENHLDRSDVEPIEDPAQAWNVLTVGAFTALDDVAASGASYDGWVPVASTGELSPFSRTSVSFQNQWPIKPEIVMEGGNAARSPSGELDWPDSLQVLTTNRDHASRLLTTSNATSAASGLAAELVAAVSAEYPSLWPETIRALVVHSAEWTQPMQDQFGAASNSKTAREALVRRYGFGVPSLPRAIRSGTDALTLILQDTIHPFTKGRLNEMHMHDLPWPTAALEALAESPVRLRVTLSYFIEPNPGRRGWRRRFRYASHGLRFELKLPEETDDDFRKRLNKRALDEEEDRPTGGATDDWYLGSRARTRGSLHSDFWDGTATELASRGKLAVYPVSGWWKDQPARDRSKFGVRYGLTVSIQTPVQTADLWTPVAQQVGVPIIIET